MPPNAVYEINVILMLTPDKDGTQKRKTRGNDVKIIYTILANWIH